MSPVIQGISLAIALFGAALGVYNAWQANLRDRTRIKTSVGIMKLKDGRSLFSVEVVNLSTFPVTISEIALSAPEGRGTRFCFIPPFADGTTLPVVINARASRVFSMAPVEQHRDALALTKWLLVKTGDERVFKSTSPMLRSLIDKARTAYFAELG